MKKHIIVITTGGTIAMKKDPETGGLVPAVSGEDLAAAVPGLSDWADVSVVEFSNVPSGWMSAEKMFDLSHLIDKLSEEGKADGFVVTHGTDTLEETAFFDDMSKRMGVLVCLQDRIYAAKDVTKSHTTNPDTFRDLNYGPLGAVYGKEIIYGRRPMPHARLHPETIEPNVWLISAWSGMDGEIVKCAGKAGVKGVVIDGLGCGNVPPLCRKEILALRKQGIPVVLTTRVPSGSVMQEYSYEGSALSMKESGIILGGDLSGWKARLLLVLALGETNENERLQEIFEKM